MTMDFDEEIKKYADETIEEYTKDLCKLIEIPTVSSDKSKKEEQYKILRETSRIVEPIGFRAEIVETNKGQGNPTLIATLKINDNGPWLWIYNHLDVQPAQEKEWKSEPFKPIIKEGRIIGRGSTDDKGPALAVIKAIKFLRDRNYPLPNIQLVYETEEEIGSPNFGSMIEENLNNGKLKNPNSILVSDSEFEGEHPSISYKLRGCLTAYASLELADREAHSGTVGGIAVNPLKVLISALSTCYDGNKITIPGWHDEVLLPDNTEKEYSRIAAEKFKIEKFLSDLGIRELTTINPEEIIHNVWHQPSFEIHGFEDVQYEKGVTNNSVPKSATAKITLRIVPKQKPEVLLKLLEKHLRKTHEKIKIVGKGLPAFITRLDNEFVKKAEEACIYGFEKEPLFVGAGGTIGAVSEMQRVLGEVPVILLSQSLLSDGYHASNEEFRIEQAKKGIKTTAQYITSIARMK